MASLSVVISAFNEEDKIRDCLESIKNLASEMIFVDNSSSDKTPYIAKRYTGKVFIVKNNPMLNVNKNYGFSKATGDWILSLDADERVTPELSKEIKEKIGNLDPPVGRGNSDVVGYWIPRKNIIFGKWIEHTGWYPDYQLRLFRKGKGRFPEEHVHEMIKVEGEVDHLKNHIVHYNYETISQFLNKMSNIYVPNEAEQLIKSGYKFNWQDSIRFPVREFLSRFFAREGYKDGFYGLMLSMLMAFYHFIVFVNLWERNGFKKIEDDKLLKDVEKEFDKSYKEILFWFSNTRFKNPLKRALYKLTKRLK